MEKQAPTTSRSATLKAFGAGVLVVVALIFVFQNTAKGHVKFLFWGVSMSSWIWLLLVFLVGVAAGSLFPWLRPRRTDKR